MYQSSVFIQTVMITYRNIHTLIIQKWWLSTGYGCVIPIQPKQIKNSISLKNAIKCKSNNWKSETSNFARSKNLKQISNVHLKKMQPMQLACWTFSSQNSTIRWLFILIILKKKLRLQMKTKWISHLTNKIKKPIFNTLQNHPVWWMKYFAKNGCFLKGHPIISNFWFKIKS